MRCEKGEACRYAHCKVRKQNDQGDGGMRRSQQDATGALRASPPFTFSPVFLHLSIFVFLSFFRYAHSRRRSPTIPADTNRRAARTRCAAMVPAADSDCTAVSENRQRNGMQGVAMFQFFVLSDCACCSLQCSCFPCFRVVSLCVQPSAMATTTLARPSF